MASSSSFTGHRWREHLAAVVLLLNLCACGGGDDGPSQPVTANTPGTTVGAAGGTVLGPNGATLQIPPGALTADVRINIEPTSAGAPALPVGLTPSGAMFAFTPHGTVFAAPVTLTLPFDASSLPAGAAPAFYKTNSQNQWELMNGATFNATTVVVQLSSFSFGQVVVPPVTRSTPQWEWEFKSFPGIGRPPVLLPAPDGQGSQNGGQLGQFVDFGKAFFDRPFLLPPNGGRAEDGRANGLVAATEDGVTFGAFTEAPNDGLFQQTNIGSSSKLVQRQSYRKNAANASLSFTLTHAEIEATDFHDIDGNHGNLPEPQRTRYLMTGQLHYTIKAYKGSSFFFSAEAQATMDGNGSTWTAGAANVGSARTPLWSQQDFDFTTTPILYSLGINGCPGTGASLKLKAPRTITIDLKAVNPDEEFTVEVTAEVTALNRRGGGRIEECNIGSVSAFLKDPQQVSGTTMASTGLEPTNRPLPPPEQPLSPPATCATPNPAAGQLQFEAPAFAVGEYAGAPPVIKVTRTGGSSGEVSATFSTRDGTALAGTDYLPVNASVFFADGDSTPRYVTVPTIQNETVAPDKTVNLSLSQPGGCATLGAPSTAVLTLVDDTGVPVPTFTVGGTLSGLAGSGLVLREALGGSSVTPGNGVFQFPVARPAGSGYEVRVDVQPTNPIQTCSVSNGSGTIASANVDNVAVTCTTPAANGALDDTFGSGGKVATGITYLPTGANTRMAMAVQADGRILLLGGLKLARFNVNGTPDTGFGSAGIVAVPFNGGPFDQAQGLAVQADGRIVVAGNMAVGGTAASNDDFAIARFNIDGSLDTSFGSAGLVTTDFSGSQDVARRVAIQTDGKLLVGGYSTVVLPTITDTGFAIARYNPDGSLDTGFVPPLGRRSDGFAGSITWAQGMTLQRDGKIVLVGRTARNGGANPDVGLARYQGGNAAGAISPGEADVDFGLMGTGLANSDLNLGDWEEGVDVVERYGADGDLLVASPARVAGKFQFGLARFSRPNGSPKAGIFDGVSLTDLSGQSDMPRALALQADGKVLMVGQSATLSSNPDMAIVRYSPQGSIDTSFGNGGKLGVDFFGSIDGAEAVAVQADGKIVVGGFARNAGATTMALVRLMP